MARKEKTRPEAEPYRNERGTPEAMNLTPGAIPWPVSAITVSGSYRSHRVIRSTGIESARGDPELGREGELGPEELEAAVEAMDVDPAGAAPLQREELRLDVDGRYPQMTASGTIRYGLAGRVEWIARLHQRGRNLWQGPIWYRDGVTGNFPYTRLTVAVNRSLHASHRLAVAHFQGGSFPGRLVVYRYASPHFRQVEFEFDYAEDSRRITSCDTDGHPNRPVSLPLETVTVDDIFERAGFHVSRAQGATPVVPKPLAGADGVWSDMEMHDAMQTFWSRFDDRAQWSMWTFFAAMHEWGTGLGGIMFDDIGPNHRQGTAIFTDSFVSQAPAGDVVPDGWVNRMLFWTTCHEMGHAFNLAHSWQKSLIFNGNGPWIPLADEPEARSFMNYPYRVSGGEASFFSDFEYRFSDSELLFLRHAPERFVEMGNAEWFDHHGFEQADTDRNTDLKLELRANRDRPEFEFMETPVLELKLTNISDQPQLIEEGLLEEQDHMTIIVKREGQPARQLRPYVQRCSRHGQTVLLSGRSEYASLFVATGIGGFHIAEPGHYLVQVALHRDGADIVSNPLRVRVAPPLGHDEEYLAQDFFSDEVGRLLAFDGGRCFAGAVDVLQAVVERLPDRRVAHHARIPLANTLAHDFKELQITTEATMLQPVAGVGSVKKRGADLEGAVELFESVLVRGGGDAAETLGHVDYKDYADGVTAALERAGERGRAHAVQECLRSVLADRGVLGSVLEAIDERIGTLQGKKARKARKAPAA